MSATRETPEAEPEAAQTYFRLLEEGFLRLRGAAVLLAPADWQTARRWRELGIPAELVIATMESVWRRRVESGAPARWKRINSLRYFAPAVEAAWEEVSRLGAAGRRREEPAIDAPARLERLAGALPVALPGRDQWAARVRGLQGSNQAIEDGLATIDRQLIESVGAQLELAERAAIDSAVARRLAPLAGRLDADQLAEAGRRLGEQELRRTRGLPVLSLFSPAAREPTTD
jgi:hypothetical protein